MSSNHIKLKEKWAPLGDAVIPGGVQRKLAAMAAGFRADGRIYEEVLAASLPAFIYSWYLSGTPGVANNVSAEYDLTSMVKLRTLRARAKTSPTTNEFTARLTANGVEVDTVSIGIGETLGISAINRVYEAGTILRLDVLTVGAAANVTVSIGYAPASE